MPFDKLKFPDELWEDRRKGLAQSLRSISIEELTTIAKEHQEEFVGDPWTDEFQRLIAEQPHASFYHAVPEPGLEVLYCRDADCGFWVVPGSGTGPLDATGKRLIKEAIDGSLSGRNIGKKR